MGMAGKPDGLCGSDVETYFRDGKVREIAAYCESDVVNTYRLWLRRELFRGGIEQTKYEESEHHLKRFLDSRRGSVSPSVSSEHPEIHKAKLSSVVEDGIDGQSISRPLYPSVS